MVVFPSWEMIIVSKCFAPDQNKKMANKFLESKDRQPILCALFLYAPSQSY